MMEWEKKATALALTGVLMTGLLTACGSQTPTAEADAPGETAYTDTLTMDGVTLEEEMVALSEAPATCAGLGTEAPGILVKEKAGAAVDYSNTEDGYVMARYTGQSDRRLKVQVKGPTTTYTYNLPVGVWTAFPLSDGNGDYTVFVYQNVKDSTYSPLLSAAFGVTLTDEFAPFLRPNQYVDYSEATNTKAKAAQLTAGMTDPLAKVEAVYDYVVSALTYDREKAATVKSGYLPKLDEVLAKGKGICFDYAALMAGMLRSQGVPCKLVVGYSGSAYHAWISVWSETAGWIDSAIYFDGVSWMRMDPTYASTGNRSGHIMRYIGNGANYTEKYFY